MTFLNFLKKKNIPDELPKLVVDEIEEGPSIKDSKEKEEVSKKIIHSYLKEKEEKSQATNQTLKKSSSQERSFFKELQNNINEEINNLNKLENWYNNKFLPRDIVSDMKDYWEKQKKNSVIQVLGKHFEERITEKTIKLKELEKEWQDIYFDLIEKEEEIREKEQELKKILAEFVEMCKRKQKERKR